MESSWCLQTSRNVSLWAAEQADVTDFLFTSTGFGLCVERLAFRSPHIAPLLKAKGYRPGGIVRGAPANSPRLQSFCGDAWLAVGDAAQAYDPLSSQGIDKALRTDSHAGHMIHYALTDCAQGTVGLDSRNIYIQQYDEQQQQL